MGFKETLADALFVSETTGKEREFRLQRGLIISVRVTQRMTRLRLSRNGSVPSLREWRTVLSVWPYPCAGIEPHEVSKDGHAALLATWPTPVRLLDV
jgi:hypothetical protein